MLAHQMIPLSRVKAKILNLVVGAVVVNVMNLLARIKKASKVLLHYSAMLKDHALGGHWVLRYAKQDVASASDLFFRILMRINKLKAFFNCLSAWLIVFHVAV